MKSIRLIFGIVWNKYLITIIAFCILMLFFDSNSYLAHRKLNAELEKVSEEKEFYIQQISADSKRANELMSDDDNLERFAREHYLMKKEKEDIYLLIVEE